MLDYIIQNFNLVSFAIALSVFIVISSLGRLISNYIVMRKYQKKAKVAEAELAGYMDRIKKSVRGQKNG